MVRRKDALGRGSEGWPEVVLPFAVGLGFDLGGEQPESLAPSSAGVGWTENADALRSH